MFKKIIAITAFLAVAGILIFGAIYRTQAKDGHSDTYPAGQGNGGLHSRDLGSDDLPANEDVHPGLTQLNPIHSDLDHLPLAEPESLSAEEIEALQFMREEEKLARDVYLALYDQWGLAIFQNIAASEQTHTNAVLALLEGYNLPDPASAQAGVFTNPDLQALYSELIVQGSQSLPEALNVGGTIEELDILDLRARLALTDNQDIIQVFNSLLKGSTNHLRAFANVLVTQTGETYQPQYLSLEDYLALVGASGSGSANGGRGNGGRGGGHGGNP